MPHIAPDGSKQVSLWELYNTLKEVFMLLLRKWWLILLVTVIGGGLGFYYAGTKTAQYQSRLTFSLEDNNGGGLGGALSIAAEFGFNVGGSSGAFSGDNILEILVSRRIVEGVLLKVDSSNGKPVTYADEFIRIGDLRNKGFNKPYLANISFPAGQARSTFSYLQDSVLYVLYQKIVNDALIASKPDKKLNLYEVKFTYQDERFSRTFTQLLIDEATAFYTELRSKRSKETLDILESRVASLKGSLNSAIGTRATSQDANLNPAFSEAQIPMQRKEADIKVYGTAYAELFKNLELARYQYLKSIPLLQVIDAPQYPLKKIKMGRLVTGIIFAFIAFMIITMLLLLRHYFLKAKNAHRSKAEEPVAPAS